VLPCGADIATMQASRGRALVPVISFLYAYPEAWSTVMAKRASVRSKGKKPETVTITRLTHDMRLKRSWVTMVWDEPPDRHIGLEVPFGTAVADIHKEAEAAVRKFASEFSVTVVRAASK
jgi:hypothetical protein